MKLHVMSDLHLEMRSPNQFFGDQMIPSGEVLVLAGDITYLRHFEIAQPIFQKLCARHKQVLYVPGNHEYYKSSIFGALEVLKLVEASIPNLKVLRSGEVFEFEGKRFLGDTMWFRDHPDNLKYEAELNDFSMIRDLKPWVYEENKKFLDFLSRELKTGDIVITHHLPTEMSIGTRFKGEPTNRFFLCDVMDLIKEKQPLLWIHGHTHDHFDYRVDGSRIYCNPLGYPAENKTKNWKTKIEIEI